MTALLWWFRIKGTVIVRIWWQVVGLLFYATGIVAIHEFTEYKLGFEGTIITVIGAVVSLLMGFRTNSAYARYWDGRIIWAQMTKNIRALVLLIWTNVQGTEVTDIIEKKSTINLCVAFAYAMKYYLRDDYSYTNDDFQYLIFPLQKYYDYDEEGIDPAKRKTSSVSKSVAMEMTDRRKGSARSLKDAKDDEVFLNMTGEQGQEVKGQGQKSSTKGSKKKPVKLMAYDLPTPSNIPLEILCHLHAYLNHLASKEKKPESFVFGAMNSAIQGLLETLTNFERVSRTPIPLAYSIHLHHVVWLYLLAVPFQFVAKHSWGTIIIMAFGSFCMLGILSIATEIEDPFGDDANDLPLDDFCIVLKREVELITGCEPPETKSWVFSEKNTPFKYSGINDTKAGEWATKSKEELTAMLQKNAKAHFYVDKLLRHRK